MGLPGRAVSALRRHWVLSALGVALTLIVAGAWLDHSQFQSLREAQGWTQRSERVMTRVHEVEARLNSVVASRRGYLLTRDERERTVLRDGILQIDSTLAELDRLVVDPAQRARVTRLARLVAQRLDAVRRTLEPGVGEFDFEHEVLITREGSAELAAIRSLLAETRAAQDALISRRTAHLQQELAAAEQRTLAGVAAVLVILSLVFFALHRQLLERNAFALRVEENNRELETALAERRARDQKLRATEERFRALSNCSPVGIFMCTDDGVCVYVNREWQKIAGLTEEEALGQGWFRVLHPEDAQQVMRHWVEARRARREYRQEFRVLRPDGEIRWISGRASPVRDDEGQVSHYVGTHEDITEKRRAGERIREAQEGLERQVGLLERRQREMRFLSEMGEKLQTNLGPEESYAVIEHFAGLLFDGTSGEIDLINNSRTLIERVARWGAETGGAASFSPDDCWALRTGKPEHHRGDGIGLHCRHMGPSPTGGRSICIPMHAQGEMIGILHLACDEGACARAEERSTDRDDRVWLATTLSEQVSLALANLRLRETLRHQAIRDPLTGLFNRRYMEESFERELRRAQRGRQPVSVFMLDIDHFKRYNDSHGHAAGDELLRQFGALLRGSVRGGDIACRFGGEEFVAILPDAGIEDARVKAESIRAAAATLTVMHMGQPLPSITVSIGVATFPAHGAAVDPLLQQADQALYRAKRSGRNRIVAAGESGEAGDPEIIARAS
jgi:diguanylate cyclase (GGDEF)-like protein/PAS domain S-box-containing protein